MTTNINLQSEITKLKVLAPKEIEKLAKKGISPSQKVNSQLNQKILRLVANQAQSKPAIVRRNSPNQG
jgi:hypothetical protein